MLTSIILMGWQLPNPNSYDFSDRAQIKKIWLLFRIHLRNKNYAKYSKAFKLDNVTNSQVALVKRILAPHKDMNFNMIRREWKASAFMYEWTKCVLKYVEIKRDLESIGVKQLEDRISNYNHISEKMIKVFDRILANQEFQ